MGVRLFLRADRHRAERDLPADLVQEARLDLGRDPAWIRRLGIVLIAWGASVACAHAQPLLQDPPLTTLLKPQQLDRSRPLLPQDRVVGPRPGAQGGRDPLGCTRTASAAPTGANRPAPGSNAEMGGSGPGEFAQYMQGASPGSGRTAASSRGVAASPDKPTTSAIGGVGHDKPLYGGNDRPLWSTGDARTPPTRSSTGEAPPGGVDPAGPAVLPRDKPLWASGDQADPSMPAPDGVGSDRAGSLALQRSLAGLPPCIPMANPGLLTH